MSDVDDNYECSLLLYIQSLVRNRSGEGGGGLIMIGTQINKVQYISFTIWHKYKIKKLKINELM
jgi:hypothetical protein